MSPWAHADSRGVDLIDQTTKVLPCRLLKMLVEPGPEDLFPREHRLGERTLSQGELIFAERAAVLSVDHVIVVDDASRDDTEKVTKELGMRKKL